MRQWDLIASSVPVHPSAPPLALKLTLHLMHPEQTNWIVDGALRLCVAKGTLVPAATLRSGA